MNTLLTSLKNLDVELTQIVANRRELHYWIAAREQGDATLRALANATASIVATMDARFDRVDSGMAVISEAIDEVQAQLNDIDSELVDLAADAVRTQSLVLRNHVQLLDNGRLVAAAGSKMLGAIDSVGMDLIDEIRRGNAMVVNEVSGQVERVVGDALAVIVDGQGQILAGQEDILVGQEQALQTILQDNELTRTVVVRVGEEIKEVRMGRGLGVSK